MTTTDYFTLLKKAEKGDCDAQFNVGHYYYRLREFKKAYSWWLKCSKHKKRLGPIFNIGNLYYNGWGLKQDIKKAPILYPKENVIYTQLALFLIGKTYFDGTFVKRNKKKGLNYYEQAAKAGNINAASTLESIYSNEENYNLKKKIWYSPKYGHVFPGKYLLFGTISIAGLFYFENSLIRIIKFTFKKSKV